MTSKKVIRCTIQGRETRLSKPYPKQLIDKLTSYSVPGAYFMPLYRRTHVVRKFVDGEWREVTERIWDGKKHFFHDGKLPTGVFLTIIPALEKKGWKFKAEVAAPSPKPPRLFDNLTEDEIKNRFVKKFPTARPYQIEAVTEMAKYSGLGGLILQCTGSGKTYLAAMLMSQVPENVSCLFVVDELTLLHQAQEEIQKVAKEEIGIVGEGTFNPKRITVATTQTLSRFKSRVKFKEWFHKIQVVIIDEIHVQMNRRNFKVLQTIQPRAVYGLTATLQMKKKNVSLRAYSIAGPVIYTYPLKQGIQEKFLTPVVVVKVPFLSFDWYRNRYTEAYRHRVVLNKKRNDLIQGIAETATQTHNKKVIILAEHVKHLRILNKRLFHKKTALVYGAVPSKERIRIQKEFESGKLNLIITNKVFEKGVNIKSVDTGIDCSAMKSKNKAIQRVGRFVRLCQNKPYAIYLDIADQGCKFEKNWKSRLSAYRGAGIPVVVWEEDESWDEMIQKVEKAVRKLQK